MLAQIVCVCIYIYIHTLTHMLAQIVCVCVCNFFCFRRVYFQTALAISLKNSKTYQTNENKLLLKENS